MLWFYHFANFVFRMFFRVVFDYRIEGLENVPPHGPLIVAINHTSFTDPLMAGAFIPRHIIMMAKAELFEKPLFRYLIAWYGAFPVRRGAGDLSAMRRSLQVLGEGKALLVAPEGTRSDDGRLQPGKEGTALLALRTGAAILPVALWGAKDMWRNLRRLRRTRVHMVIGKPFRLPVQKTRPSREELRQLTDEIMRHIAVLLPPELRGAYADVEAGEVEQVAATVTG